MTDNPPHTESNSSDSAVCTVDDKCGRNVSVATAGLAGSGEQCSSAYRQFCVTCAGGGGFSVVRSSRLGTLVRPPAGRPAGRQVGRLVVRSVRSKSKQFRNSFSVCAIKEEMFNLFLFSKSSIL